MKYDDTEWYRSSRWDPEIEQAFETRLRRARPNGRNQYIRIQGLHLVGQDDPAVREVGRALLRRAAHEEPTPYEFERLSALESLGDALLRDGYLQEAEPILREVIALTGSLATGRSGTSGVTELTVAELLLARADEASLVEADVLLDQVEPRVLESAMFRDLVVRYLTCRARVSSARADPRACDYATEAILVANETKPSIPRHPDVGRPNVTTATLADLEAIVHRFS